MVKNNNLSQSRSGLGVLWFLTKLSRSWSIQLTRAYQGMCWYMVSDIELPADLVVIVFIWCRNL